MVTYCTVNNVEEVLQLDYSFSASTTPTDSTVESYIERAEKKINERTRHSWKEETTSQQLDIPNDYEPNTGVPIYLKHRSIRNITALSVWNGSEYENYLTTKTEGRDEDYWLDESQGVLYLKSVFRAGLKKGLKITYTYGETTVPKDIEEATALLAAVKILQSDDRSALVSDSGAGNNIPYDSRVREWKAEADKIISTRSEIVF